MRFSENNLFLVRRILGRIGDMRNADPGPGRYTSLAWAAVCAHEEIFGYLLGCGHDDDELSRVRHKVRSFSTLALTKFYPGCREQYNSNLTGWTAFRLPQSKSYTFPPE